MFKNEADFEKLVSRLNIDNEPNPAHRENLRRQMLSAFNEAGEQPGPRTTVFQALRRTIMKRSVPKLAAAAAAVILIAVVIGIYEGGGGIERIALAEVIEKTQRMPWMKVKVAGTEEPGGEKEVYHQWYHFRSKRMFTKRAAYVRLSDLAKEKDYFYRFSDNTLIIKKLVERFFWADSPIGFWGKLVEELESEGWHLTQRRDKFGSADVEVFEFSRPLPWNSLFPIVNGTEVSKERWELIVDRKSKLVIGSSSEWIDKKDEVLRQSEWLISYPESGPKDIYALGVPRTAKIIDKTRLPVVIPTPGHQPVPTPEDTSPR